MSLSKYLCISPLNTTARKRKTAQAGPEFVLFDRVQSSVISFGPIDREYRLAVPDPAFEINHVDAIAGTGIGDICNGVLRSGMEGRMSLLRRAAAASSVKQVMDFRSDQGWELKDIYHGSIHPIVPGDIVVTHCTGRPLHTVSRGTPQPQALVVGSGYKFIFALPETTPSFERNVLGSPLVMREILQRVCDLVECMDGAWDFTTNRTIYTWNDARSAAFYAKDPFDMGGEE
jgi:hypothetical protein